MTNSFYNINKKFG